MIIDAHQHAFWGDRDDAGLVADMDTNAIDRAWLLSWEIPPDQDDRLYHKVLSPRHLRPDGTHAGVVLADLIIARDRYPDRFILGYCPNPALPTAPELLEAARNIHGCRLCGEWKFRMLLDDPRCIELFRTAGRLGMPVTVHIDVPYRPDDTGQLTYQPLWYGGSVANLERSIQACPATTFIGHAPGFWRQISGDADRALGGYPSAPVSPAGRLYDLFDRYSNLMGDLSAQSGLNALSRDPDHARQFLTRFADRLLLARDDYGPKLLDFLAALDLPADVQQKLYYQNAERLLSADPA